MSNLVNMDSFSDSPKNYTGRHRHTTLGSGVRMAIKFDEDGELDLSALTEEDIEQISEKVIKFLEDAQTAWSETYGPSEYLSMDELDEEALHAKLNAVDDALVWAHVDIYDATTITPIEGLDLQFNGSAWVPGKGAYFGADGFAIAQKPWSGDPYAIDPVFTYAQCLCPFCEDGEFKGEECTICLGAGDWGIDL
jgi:hypothetical protein